jgi:signal peptidase I
MNFVSRHLPFTSDRKVWSEAELMFNALERHRRYGLDVLKPKDLTEIETVLASYQAAARKYDRAGLEEFTKKAARLGARMFPGDSLDWVRENVEVMFVAIVVALAVRTYFIQPFKIPTHSMRPTLYGEVPVTLTEEPPNVLKQVFDTVFLGRSYHSFKLAQDDTIMELREGTIGPWFTYTDVIFQHETHRIWARMNHVRELGLMEGKSFTAGNYALNASVDSGDVVLVNRLTYNFRLPNRGEVFVFSTANIDYIKRDRERRGDFAEGSQFYIKRCVGVPGDSLSINEPFLLNHGQALRDPEAFLKVESAKNGYRGYTILGGQTLMRDVNETYDVTTDHFFAMGDNSYQSLDSRFWGPVPRENLVGTGLLVLWPFTNRWGFIR